MTQVRMGIQTTMLTIAEKVEVRDIEYRHVERMNAGIAAHTDMQSVRDGARLNEISSTVVARREHGICAGAMNTLRSLERADKPMKVTDLVPLGAGSATTCQKYLKTLMAAGVVRASDAVRGGYEIAA